MPKFTSSRWFNVFIQIAIWIAFLLIPFSIRSVVPTETTDSFLKEFEMLFQKNQGYFFGVFLLHNCFMILLFYLNYIFLVPKIFVQRGFRWYLAAIVGISLFWIYGFNPIFNRIFLSDLSATVPSTPLILMFIASFAVRLAIDKLKEEKQREERAKENYQSELSFLRSQISPHFLFNIMNSLVAMSRIKPQLVEPTLIKLSSLMRYMLYESDETKVSIERETEYLESYIELQKIRFGESVNIVFDKHTEGSQCHIEPMLLIPFVENAFKHGVTMIDEPEIKIRLTTDNNQLIFDVTNKMNPQNNEIKDDSSGIGLKNVSRRLDLLYPKAHNLAIDTEGGLFSVHLTIFLTKLNS